LTAERSGTTRTLTLDDYCRKNNIEKIDLLKLDIEGGELRALWGARNLFAENRIDACLVEVSDDTLEPFDDSAHELIEFLEANGIRTHVIEDGALRPFRIAGKRHGLTNVVGLSQASRERMLSDQPDHARVKR
jgi:hypothetical protein